MEDNSFYERYHRQLILEGFGMAAQEKLRQAKVLVVGAGGLGCPVLSYLAGAGIGKIGIADDGLVELSNLHRQVLYSVHDIGKYKVDCARQTLNALNPEVDICTYPVRLTPANSLDIIRAYDIVIDGLDNFEGKYMLNDACALLNKPLVYAAITRFEGQVAIFNVLSNHQKVNYRDIFPYPPHQEETMSCSEAGVLGILPGITGSFQANECIKLITGLGKPLINQLLTYNALTNEIYTIDLSPTALSAALIPKNEVLFEAASYELSCAPDTTNFEIDSTRFWDLIKTGDADIVDVRELGEQPVLKGFDYLSIPLPQLSHKYSEIKKNTVIFVCQSGKRSLLAARQFNELGLQGRIIYSLKDGIAKLGK